MIKIRLFLSWWSVKQPIPEELCCISMLCTKHHNWFQPVIISCNLQWQHCILESTKWWYHDFWIIIIRVFEHTLSTASANNCKIDDIHWWLLVKAKFYPHAGQKCNFHQEIIFNTFKYRPKDLMNIKEEWILDFILKSRQECHFILAAVQRTALSMTLCCDEEHFLFLWTNAS